MSTTTDTNPDTGNSQPTWVHYGVIVEELGGCWQGVTIGPVTNGIAPAASIPTGRGVEAPLLGVWDHEPSPQEIDAVTPWDYRWICPACGQEGCDDEMHSLENWCEKVDAAASTE